MCTGPDGNTNKWCRLCHHGFKKHHVWRFVVLNKLSVMRDHRAVRTELTINLWREEQNDIALPNLKNNKEK